MELGAAREELVRLQDVTVLEGERLARHGSLRLGGEIDLYVVAHDAPAMEAATAICRRHKVPLTVSYGGADLAGWEDGLAGALVRLGAGLQAARVEDGGRLRVGAACPVAAVGVLAAAAGLAGLAPLSGLPGTVGGWLAAEGVIPLAPLLAEVTILTGRGLKTLRPDEAAAHPSPPAWIEVVFAGAWRRGIPEPAAPGALALPSVRDLPNLLARSGLLGVRLRGLRLSPEAPGLVVHTGGSAPPDLDVLLRLVKDRLHRDHGFQLEPRLGLLGRPQGRANRRTR